VLIAAATVWPASQLGGEFMPPLDEGDLLYMPSALPGISSAKASELLQQTDRMIKAVPEVARVFGKAGRAETATDPAPLEMFETTIQFKPRDQWRAGMTPDKLVEELDRTVKVPGLRSMIMVQRIRRIGDKVSTEWAYYISSLDARRTAQQFAGYIRGHWGIENNLHWQLDVSFREDERRIRKGHGAEHFSRLCRLALNLLKRETTQKTGIAIKRQRCGWDNDYLLKVVMA
jgi:predicted transposase YbfD/YdcC